MSEQSSPPASDAALPKRSRWRIVVVLIVLLGVLTAVVISLRPQMPSPTVTMLDGRFPAQRRSLGIISRFPMPMQRFYYRLKLALFGPAKSVNLDAAILDLKLPAEVISSNFALGRPVFTGTNGFQIWICSTNKLRKLRQQAESAPEIALVASPRIVTAHGVRAAMSLSRTVPVEGAQKQVGVVMDCLPLVRKTALDLTTMITLTDAVTNRTAATASSTTGAILVSTNLFITARMQIPDGSGVFILQRSSGVSNMTGILISPWVKR